MDIVLGNASNGPVYQQVKVQIETRIREKSISAGAALPSPGVLAQKLAVDKGEIMRAYFELEQAGLITRKSTKDFLGHQKTTYAVK
jgi:DNA-binding transcriptional regulator YhcF (GntR family)